MFSHSLRIQIEWGHCDPAGIVFYPRYVELCNEMVEDWFADGLGFPLDVKVDGGPGRIRAHVGKGGQQ